MEPIIKKGRREALQSHDMRILALVQGHYGERMVETWQRHGPEDWDVATLEIASSLPAIIEDPSAFVAADVPEADLVVSLGEHPGVTELLPDIVKIAKARTVIVPVDNRAWVPPGLAKQVERALWKMGVSVVFPVTFCTVREQDSADPLIEEFAHQFGVPAVRVETEADRVKKATVIRSAPCGSTYFVADELRGVKVQDAEEKSGLLHHNYPCLATMNVDWQFQDTLMHRAGYFTKQAVKEALKKSREEGACVCSRPYGES